MEDDSQRWGPLTGRVLLFECPQITNPSNKVPHPTDSRTSQNITKSWASCVYACHIQTAQELGGGNGT